MAMDYIRGHDLLEIIEENRAELTPDLIVRMTAKLISAVGYIHDNQLLHCDISPDNIFVTPGGEPILIDFGAARRTAAGAVEKYSGLSVVKDGYSPHELYTAGGNSGRWSDFYALAASLYHAIAGVAPPNCQSRLAALAEKRADPCKPLAGTVEGYPKGFLEAIDRAMAIMPAARFQAAADWLKAIPQPEVRSDRKVVLVRRVIPTPTEIPAKASAAAVVLPMVQPAARTRAVDTPVAELPHTALRPRRPTTRVADVDLSGLRRISGFVSGCLVDSLSGQVMAREAGQGDAEISIRAALAVARANLQAIAELGTEDAVEDIQVALGQHFHLLQPLHGAPRFLVCLTLDRDAANPGMARFQLRRVAQAIRL
jgi:hypothetical protein